MPRYQVRCCKSDVLASSLMFAVLLTSSSVLAADYTIQVSLDPGTRILQGTEVIRWTNTSEVAVSELRFHLYYNAWRSPQSSFLNSNRIVTDDFSAWKDDEWAYSDVKALAVDLSETAMGVDLSEQLRFAQPDDGNVNDQTVLVAPLPEPVPPGQEVTVRIQFEARVPRTFARTGFRGNYFFVAQWFPKLGVIQDDGTWNCHQFIQTEFFADFGNYDVEISVPEAWVVGATGREVSQKRNPDSTVVHRYSQENVHDFTWTTSPDFLVFEDEFTHPTLMNVKLRLLLMPDHLGQQERYFRATKAGLKYYGEWFGEYPYPNLTIVDPAFESRSGGMEYPTLFTGGTRWLNTPLSGSPEGVTVHEFGHQIWYGVVANNEFEDAWMDEGFNSYSTARVMDIAFEPEKYVKRFFKGLIPLQYDSIQVPQLTASGYGGRYAEFKWDVMSKPSWQYGPAPRRYRELGRSASRIYTSGAYGLNSYGKPALMLKTLEGYLGWETLQRILSTYFERWKFRHPHPEDFFQVAEEVSGQDLDWFWNQTYHSSDVVDYGVDWVENRPDRKFAVIRRWGEAVFPVEVEISFDKGQSIREEWDGVDRWKRLDFLLEDYEITSIVVDPARKLALDVNRTNNSWVAADASRLAGRKWASKWMFWVQNLLEFFAFFA